MKTNIHNKINQNTNIINYFKEELLKFGIDVNSKNYSISYMYEPQGAIYYETKNHKQKISVKITDNRYAISLLDSYYNYLNMYNNIKRIRK